MLMRGDRKLVTEAQRAIDIACEVCIHNAASTYTAKKSNSVAFRQLGNLGMISDNASIFLLVAELFSPLGAWSRACGSSQERRSVYSSCGYSRWYCFSSRPCSSQSRRQSCALSCDDSCTRDTAHLPPQYGHSLCDE